MELRDYQQKTIDMLYQWFGEHKGNPCVVLPTGAGKSVIIAGFCQRAIRDYPETRILMATHQKELIEQDASKVLELWKTADVGIYSAGIGLKESGHQLTFGSIQTMYRHIEELGSIDLMIVDECHLINSKQEGMYRTMVDGLLKVNPRMKVIGLTATPYRLGHGLITDKPALFDAPMIEPVTVKELQERGYLSRLTSKSTGEKLKADGVAVTAGEYNSKQLQEAVDVPGKTKAVVEEVIRRADGRKSWLFFCSGVEHAQHVCDLLNQKGIYSACVTGETPKDERERILEAFKKGEYRAITNANVLTTGFDNPRIDLIVMMRPTLSPGLYVQMAGRGLRTFSGKQDCLVLDFAGNVEKHGPIADVVPPQKKRGGHGIPPCKTCPACLEIVPVQTRVCPQCGKEFPVNEREKTFQLGTADIEGKEDTRMEVRCWWWQQKTSNQGNRMIQVIYQPKDYTQNAVSQFLLLWHDNPWIRNESRSELNLIFRNNPQIEKSKVMTTEQLCQAMNFRGKPPESITYRKKGKYMQHTGSFWRTNDE